MTASIKLSAPEAQLFWEIPVLHEDADFLALDKPSGLLVSPDGLEPERPSVLGLIHQAIAQGKPWTREHGLSFLMNTHRLDPEASGVLLLAKSKPVLVSVLDAFGSERATQRYVALIGGSPPEATFTVDEKLGPHPAKPRFVRVDSRHGKRSRTVFEVLERYQNYTLVKCVPTPDRLHQVRVHARHVGHAVVGDDAYRGRNLWLSSLKQNYVLKPNKTERPLISSAALHHEEIEIPHPTSGEKLKVTAPWPKELNVALKYLRRYNA